VHSYLAVYPDAVGTTIETVPSISNHCGVCHYDFSGGGTRNPYGALLELELPNHNSNPKGRQAAVSAIQDADPDGDGFSTQIEVTDTTTFSNTPTFPGLTPSNFNQVSNVDPVEIQLYLMPSTGGDITPPFVLVIKPNGGEAWEANKEENVEWLASDAGGIAGVNLYISDDGGQNFKPIAMGLPNTGSHTWFPANRPSQQQYGAVAISEPRTWSRNFHDANDSSEWSCA